MERKLKVLLIGGTGILSTDITDLSVKKNYEVFILNRGINKKNKNNKVIHLKGDIRKVQKIKELIKDYYFDVVVDFISYDIQDLKKTLSIFQKKCSQYIFISTATVYDETQKNEKITEEFFKGSNKWDYVIKKIECEEYLKKKSKDLEIRYSIVRPYVTYSDVRIPFAIIPRKNQWTLVDRILNKKPIVLCNGGENTCTLTYSKDFAVGIVGLFNNPKAMNEDFHITTDYVITWKEGVEILTRTLGIEEVNIANLPLEYITKNLPELKGELEGDKARNREFDNSKIKKAVPEFKAQTKFEEGIKYVIDYYKRNKELRKIDYSWNARIDKIILEYYEKNNQQKNKNYQILKNRKYNQNMNNIDKIIYNICLNQKGYNFYRIALRLKNKIIFMLKKVRL